MKSNYPLSRKEDIVIQEADGEVLIYDMSKNKAFCLNETSALVWQMCDGNKSVSEISKGISKKLGAPSNEDLVWLAIDQLKKENLIANSEELSSNFEGMSRREVIKKVGLGTMIALPIVTGLVAPTAVHALSSGQPVAGTGSAATTADARRACVDNASAQCRGGSAVVRSGDNTCTTNAGVVTCNCTGECR